MPRSPAPTCRRGAVPPVRPGHRHRRERAADAQRRIERREEGAVARQQSSRTRPTGRRSAPMARAEPHARPKRGDEQRRERPRSTITSCVSIATRCSGVDRKSRCSRLSATVACTSTPAKSVSSGVATTSRVPSAVVPDEHQLVGERPRVTRPASRRRPRRSGTCASRRGSARAGCSCRRGRRRDRPSRRNEQ